MVKQVGVYVCGSQGHDFGIVSMWHSVCNATSARQMTKNELVIKS